MSKKGDNEKIYSPEIKKQPVILKPLNDDFDSTLALQFEDVNRMSPIEALSLVATRQLDKDICFNTSPAAVDDAHLIIDAFKNSSRLTSPDAKDINDKENKPKSVYNMRVMTLNNMPISNLSNYRQSQKQESSIIRAKIGSHTNTANSLDFLRQNLQDIINKEIDEILQRYMKVYFTPAVENIRSNNGNHSVNNEHLSAICRQVLEEAKKLYEFDGIEGKASSMLPNSDLLSVPATRRLNENKRIRDSKYSLFSIKKRRGSSDSDITKPKKVKSTKQTSSGRSTPSKFIQPIKRDGPKWDPTRITAESLFIMGARANKVLGLGTTRGRIYIKHPELFKYSGDARDKAWLYENSYMPGTGGKAYILLVDDIKELAECQEYCESSYLLMEELVGFKVPSEIRSKIINLMESMRTPEIPEINVTKTCTIMNPHNINGEQDLDVTSDDDSTSLPSLTTPPSM